MDGSREQVYHDASVLHDLVDDWKDGCKFDDNGILVNEMKAKMLLFSLVQYINDIIDIEDEDA